MVCHVDLHPEVAAGLLMGRALAASMSSSPTDEDMKRPTTWGSNGCDAGEKGIMKLAGTKGKHRNWQDLQ